LEPITLGDTNWREVPTEQDRKPVEARRIQRKAWSWDWACENLPVVEPKRLAGGVGVSDRRDKLILEFLPQPRCGF